MVRDSQAKDDAGSAAVEFALVMPAVLVVLAAVMSGAVWVLDIAAAQRGAAEAARAAIVLDDAAARSAGERAYSQGSVSIERSGGYITACVDVQRQPWPTVTRCAVSRDTP